MLKANRLKTFVQNATRDYSTSTNTYFPLKGKKITSLSAQFYLKPQTKSKLEIVY